MTLQIIQQDRVAKLPTIVAPLVLPIDAALGADDPMVARLRQARLILGVPDVEIGKVISKNRLQEVIARLVRRLRQFGMPLARIVHNYDDNEAALWNANFDEGQKIAKAAGAKEVWQLRGAMPAIHLMGGTIMGTGADNSVVNSFGQAHEVPNLYVAGPGIFPTCGASNPTYTIFALSLRAAENLASNWGAIAG